MTCDEHSPVFRHGYGITANLVVYPLLAPPRVEKIKQWELLCELDGESAHILLLVNISTFALRWGVAR